MRRCATQVWPVLVSGSKESVNSPEPVSDLSRYLADFGSDRYFFGSKVTGRGQSVTVPSTTQV